MSLKESTGGIYRCSFDLGEHKFTGELIRNLVKMVAGDAYYEVPYFREDLCYVVGQMSNPYDGSDAIVYPHLRGSLPPEPFLLFPDQEYDTVFVVDGLWSPIGADVQKGNDVIIVKLEEFCKELEKAL